MTNGRWKMKYKRFEDLPVWREAYNMAMEVLRRAAISIPCNIAEGFERGSKKELIYFLFVAKGSAGELRTQIRLAKDLNIINGKESSELVGRCELISRQISAFIANIEKRLKNK